MCLHLYNRFLNHLIDRFVVYRKTKWPQWMGYVTITYWHYTTTRRRDPKPIPMAPPPFYDWSPPVGGLLHTLAWSKHMLDLFVGMILTSRHIDATSHRAQRIAHKVRLRTNPVRWSDFFLKTGSMLLCFA
jgi:hypothetical protein